MDDMEQIYQAHARTVYKFLLSQCRDADLAEELTQETFCQALRQLGSFRGDCTPQVWLCAIAKRLWYKELSRRGRTVPMDGEALAQVTLRDHALLLEFFRKRDGEGAEHAMAIHMRHAMDGMGLE